ncbi:hypothetical protein JTE90_004073 [Oedothorax gibbosus]|uniref:Uncharacterized protein n=1 Tax=Oedothorax gibbosus TaxID=931172 RepID=A0AAV6U5K9_9ARAC|nr:hypothetical protein JTE90_004073 [Oedothorax gibbosus]
MNEFNNPTMPLTDKIPAKRSDSLCGPALLLQAAQDEETYPRVRKKSPSFDPSKEDKKLPFSSKTRMAWAGI